MEPFQQAELRRRAWELLDGWGVEISDPPKRRAWSFEERLQHTDQLAKYFIDGTLPSAKDDQ